MAWRCSRRRLPESSAKPLSGLLNWRKWRRRSFRWIFLLPCKYGVNAGQQTSRTYGIQETAKVDSVLTWRLDNTGFKLNNENFVAWRQNFLIHKVMSSKRRGRGLSPAFSKRYARPSLPPAYAVQYNPINVAVDALIGRQFSPDLLIISRIAIREQQSAAAMVFQA